MTANLRLESERLLLRELNAQDAEAILSFASDAEVMKFMEPPNSLEQVRSFLDRAEAARQAQPRLAYHLAVVPKASGVLVGTASLVREVDATSVPYFGMILSRQCWRQGIAREACGVLFAFAFRELSADRVGGACNAANEPSAALMRRLGMTQVERRSGPGFEILLFEITRGR